MELALSPKAMSGTPDDSLDALTLERCRRRDLEAFGAVVDAYQSRVFGFVRRMVPTGEDAEDVTQEVFLKAYRHFESFDGRCSIRTWLFRIAHNLCIDRARRRGRTPELLSLSPDDDLAPMEIADDRRSPEAGVLSGELASLVEAAIATMSDKLRSVLLLHDREEMAYDDIAGVLGIPVGTVKSRLFLARAHLQRSLRGYLDV